MSTLKLRPPHHFWKYLLVSLVATGIDFSIFFALGMLLAGWPPSACATAGATIGGLVSWALNQFWVFPDSKMPRRRTAVRYLVGIVLGILLNGALTGIFCENLGLGRMAGRVAAAVGAWAAIYWFNRRVVFR